jgi:hypothetical protein
LAKSGVRSGILCMLIEYIGKGDGLVVIPCMYTYCYISLVINAVARRHEKTEMYIAVELELYRY